MDFQTRYKFNPKTDLLGKGGFSKVYKANDTLLDRIVALKFFTGGGSEKYRILNEIKKVIRFEHANLCKYYDVAVFNSTNIWGEAETMEVGIMEFLDAGDLKSYLKTNPQDIDKLLIDVLKGLSYLHKQGIVHRDLKPQNIIIKMVDDEAVAKITDFGISKLISSGDSNPSGLIGTVEYMAPEQFNPKKYGVGGRITTNLDIWSFGLIVYEVLQRKSLFGSRSNGTSPEQIMQNILSDSYLTRTKLLPLKYQAIVNRCLVKNASQRIQNAFELIPLFSEEPVPPDTRKIYDTGKRSLASSVPVNEQTPAATPEREVYNDTQVLSTSQNVGDDFTQVLELPEDLLNEEHHTNLPKQEELQDDDTLVIDADDNDTNDSTQTLPYHNDLPYEVTPLVKMDDGGIDDDDMEVIQQEQWINDNSIADVLIEKELPQMQIIPSKSTEAEKPIPKNQPFSQEAARDTLKTNKVRRVVLFAAIPIVLTMLFFILRHPAIPDETRSAKKAEAPATKDIIPEQPAVDGKEPDLINVWGGIFVMGREMLKSTSEFSTHTITVHDFSIGKYEVTIGEFRQFINDTKYVTTAEKEGSSQIYTGKKWEASKGVNWRYDVDGNVLDTTVKNLPVIHVSWLDAIRFCEWLSGKNHKHYRLPTESEWEYAARGGNSTKNTEYSGSNKIDDVAWFNKNAGNKVHEVGQKLANELGINDMSGNVMEWCNDWFEDYYPFGSMHNPTGPDSGTRRVVRGGSWFLPGESAGNSSRAGVEPNTRGGQLGFRICEVLN